jgi:cell division protease FtsH
MRTSGREGDGAGMNPFYKNLALWMVIGLVVILLFNVFGGLTEKSTFEPNYSDFLKNVEAGRVDSVTIRGNLVTGKLKDGGEFRTYVVDSPDFVKTLRDKGVRISVKPVDQNPWYMSLLISWFPMVLLIGVWIFFMRQMQGGGAKALSFGKARARLISEKHNKITFADVAGVDEAKEELREIIEFLKDPQKFQKLGGKIPKGVLLVGPPGTGKTLLAKAIAGEANVPFFSISGSDFVEMFVGVGASRVRDLFEQGKKHAPCIIFMDEIDAVGRHRGAGLGGGHDEREQTLNQLLVEMDGFETNEGVILIAATNRPDVLDPALLRPGRFDRQVVVPRPDVKGREEILRVHSRRIPIAPDVELKVLARGTPGFSGADLANLVNEAALLAARQTKKLVEMTDFENAKDKVLMGVERRSVIISEEEKRTIAYHEAGHTLVAQTLPGADPVHKVTIIPRGRALGLTQQLPTEDKYNYSRDYLLNRITILLGGRAAEEMVLHQQTTGAGDDLEKATEMARKMVCEWGMSEKLGPLTFGKREEHIFLGREFARQQDYSEDTAVMIDAEVKRIVLDCASRARTVLEEQIAKLHGLAKALLEHESLDGEEIAKVLSATSLGALEGAPA